MKKNQMWGESFQTLSVQGEGRSHVCSMRECLSPVVSALCQSLLIQLWVQFPGKDTHEGTVEIGMGGYILFFYRSHNTNCDFVICADLTGLSVKTGVTNGLGQQFCNGQ